MQKKKKHQQQREPQFLNTLMRTDLEKPRQQTWPASNVLNPSVSRKSGKRATPVPRQFPLASVVLDAHRFRAAGTLRARSCPLVRVRRLPAIGS